MLMVLMLTPVFLIPGVIAGNDDVDTKELGAEHKQLMVVHDIYQAPDATSMQDGNQSQFECYIPGMMIGFEAEPIVDTDVIFSGVIDGYSVTFAKIIHSNTYEFVLLAIELNSASSFSVGTILIPGPDGTYTHAETTMVSDDRMHPATNTQDRIYQTFPQSLSQHYANLRAALSGISQAYSADQLKEASAAYAKFTEPLAILEKVVIDNLLGYDKVIDNPVAMAYREGQILRENPPDLIDQTYLYAYISDLYYMSSVNADIRLYHFYDGPYMFCTSYQANIYVAINGKAIYTNTKTIGEVYSPVLKQGIGQLDQMPYSGEGYSWLGYAMAGAAYWEVECESYFNTYYGAELLVRVDASIYTDTGFLVDYDEAYLTTS